MTFVDIRGEVKSPIVPSWFNPEMLNASVDQGLLLLFAAVASFCGLL
jgi:hypothetical protein